MHIPVHYYSSVVVEICSLCMYNSFITTEHHIGSVKDLRKARVIYIWLYFPRNIQKISRPNIIYILSYTCCHDKNFCFLRFVVLWISDLKLYIHPKCYVTLFYFVSRVVIWSLYLFIVNKRYFILSRELSLFDFTLHTVPCIFKHGFEGETKETKII